MIMCHPPALPGISSSSEQIPVPISNSVASPRNLDRERQSWVELVEITTLKKKKNRKDYHSQLEVGHLAIVGRGSDDCGRARVAESKGATRESLIEK